MAERRANGLVDNSDVMRWGVGSLLESSLMRSLMDKEIAFTISQGPGPVVWEGFESALCSIAANFSSEVTTFTAPVACSVYKT